MKSHKKIRENSQRSIPPIRQSNGKWARTIKEKINIFFEHLKKVFEPYPQESSEEQKRKILKYLETPLYYRWKCLKKLKTKEVQKAIQNLKGYKAPRFDYWEGTKRVTAKSFKIYNYRFQCYTKVRIPAQWKVAQIILIPKLRKELKEVKSYRSISLLPILSKIFEKLILKRIKPVLDSKSIIPEHFFREYHAIIEQVHRIVRKIRNAFEGKMYCSAVFLDVSQAFDKVSSRATL